MRIEIRNLSVGYKNKVPLLQGISMDIEPGRFVLIEGPSGSGKSSFLRTLNRLNEPLDGDILVDGEPMTSHEVTSLRRKIGYVQQTPIMLEMSVVDNLRRSHAFRAARNRTPPTDEQIRTLLDDYLLEDVDLDAAATQLSVGQKQRLALIRTLLTEPEVLLCDEPTSALDAKSRDIVQASLERLNLEKGMSVVVVTHFDFQPKRLQAQRYQLSRSKGLREVET